MEYFGYKGKIAKINLSTNEISEFQVDPKILKKYVGGRGLAVKYLLEYVPDVISALSPENIIAIVNGALTGTLAPTAARVSFASKAPETGIMTTGNAGGEFGTKLKRAGYDGLIILGKSEKPIYLLIDEQGIKVKSAGHLWGKTVKDTVDSVREEQKDTSLSVACIGPAGENLVSMSTIMIDRIRSAGRGGLGAVMGSKNLKAIAVKGSQSVAIYDPNEFMRLSLRINKRAREKGYVQKRYENGSYGSLTRYNGKGQLSTRNAQTTYFESIDSISAETFNSLFKYRTKACVSCSIPCWPVYVIKNGKFENFLNEGAHATTFKELGARCGIKNMDYILVAYAKLNEYGLDTISVPATIAFAMECYEKGILSSSETNGLELDWGRGDVVLELIDQIANKQFLGKELGFGIRYCSERWGEETKEFALHVKGLETVATDPRGLPSWGLGYAVASRGACHMRAYSVFEQNGLSEEEMREMAGTTKIGDIDAVEGKGTAVAYSENMRAYGDAIGLCHFLTKGELGFPGILSDLYSSATGIEMSPDELLQVGERILNMERIFNLRNGLLPADDTLPERYLKEPVIDGPAKGRVCNLEPMLEEYYHSRGWDRVDGYPIPEKIAQLGLGEFFN